MQLNWVLPTNFSFKKTELTEEQVEEWLKSLNNNIVLLNICDNISWRTNKVITLTEKQVEEWLKSFKVNI